jgi:hypothetical protein
MFLIGKNKRDREEDPSEGKCGVNFVGVYFGVTLLCFGHPLVSSHKNFRYLRVVVEPGQGRSILQTIFLPTAVR